MPTTAPITAIIISKNPDPVNAARTLRALAEQHHPPAEVILVDSTEGGHFADTDAECSLCTKNVKDAIAELRSQGASVEKIHDEDLGIGGARRRGMNAASEDVVWHLDSDSAPASKDWTRRALSTLDHDGVAAVGGNVAPLNNSVEGRVIGSLDAAAEAVPGGWHLAHPVRYCKEGECVWLDQDRGEDVTIRRSLKEHGRIVRDPELLMQKELPTNRQKSLRNVLVATAGGAIAGAAVNKLSGEVFSRVF